MTTAHKNAKLSSGDDPGKHASQIPPWNLISLAVAIALSITLVLSGQGHAQGVGAGSDEQAGGPDDPSRLTTEFSENVLLDRAIDPEHYIIGPGDRLLISFYELSTPPIVVEVLPEGVVSIVGVGEVELGSISLQEAKHRIINALKSRYRGRSATVSLAAIRRFKVSVTGAVQNPGAVAVTASDRVSEAIARAGGRLRNGSERGITLISDSDTLIADLAYYRATGQSKKNPYLHEGYQIFVPAVSDSFAKIESFGAVMMPDEFEYREGDRISDLLNLSFGPALNADLEKGELIRFNEDDTTTTSISVNLRSILQNPDSEANLFLQADDRLFLRAIAGFRPKEQVQIVGEVKYPGTYPIKPGCETLLELIDCAGGLLSTASLDEAEMYRSTRLVEEGETSFEKLLELSTEKLTDFELQYFKEVSAQRPGRVAVDFSRLISENSRQLDITLLPDDYIRIPKKSFAVTVLGRVVNPGLIPYREEESIHYYIQAAGGFGYKADEGDIRIIKANTGAVIEAKDDVAIAMGDKIMVPQEKPVDWWGTIKDVGLFLANLATVYIVVDQVLE